MKVGRLGAAVAVPFAVAALAGCGGGDDEQPAPAAGKIVRGETETGMQLTVETFVRPGSDPRLKKLDDYRVAGKFPAVDYHRITADNTAGEVADSGRDVTFAKNADAVAAGQGVETRFTCDLLRFEWVPQPATQAQYEDLQQSLCADGPPKPEGIAPGAKQVYYVITDRTFSQRNIRGLKIFGPRTVEFTPAD